MSLRRIMFSFVIPIKRDRRVVGGVERLNRFIATYALQAEVIVCGSSFPGTTVSGAKYIEVTSGKKGECVRTGALAASGAFVIVCDADVPVSDDDLLALVSVPHTELMVVASRSVERGAAKGTTLFRTICGILFRGLVRTLFDISADTQCGLKRFRADIAKCLFEQQRTMGLAFDVELFLLARRIGLLWHELPMTITNGSESVVSPLVDTIHIVVEMATLWVRHRVKWNKDAFLESRGYTDGQLQKR